MMKWLSDLGKKESKYDFVQGASKEELFRFIKDAELTEYRKQIAMGRYTALAGFLCPFGEEAEQVIAIFQASASMPELDAALEAKLERTEDTTGLCTVREWVDAILESGFKATVSDFVDAIEAYGPSPDEPLGVIYPCAELSYVKDGKRYFVRTVVTRVENA